MFLTTAAKNLMLNAIGVASGTNADFGSLHTAYSTTGTNEVTGGAPAYGRIALTWAAASGGSLALNGTMPTWNVPASTTVSWFGLWDAFTTGTFLGMMPLGGGTIQPCAVEVSGDITSDTIFAKAHGFALDTRVVFWGTTAGGLTVGTNIYWVVSSGLTADTFKVAATQGAPSPVDLTGTAPFSFFVQKCVPETFAGQGTYALSSASFDLAAIA